MPGSDQNIFDAQFALNQFSGNQSLLVQILEKFILQYKQFDAVIAESLKQQDFQAIKQQVHTIKGVSGNLGMKALHNACKEFEMSLSEPINQQALEEFLLIFNNTLTLIQNYSAEEGSEASPEAAPPQDNRASLLAALKRNEFISDSKLQSYCQSLDLSPEKLDKLKQAIDNLDYISAIQQLN